ncbi:MAG: SDR family NAD(P)-dependent oxidoreductase, partial [Marmoricola sp.]
FGAWYHATKFAVEGFSDCLRMELKPFGIKVVIIEPGPIITEWNEIARDSLLEMSGSGAYASYAKKAHRMLVEFDKPGRASKPETVAKKIRKAATTRRPAARYPVGRGAGMITTSRDHTPDVIFDQVISRMYGTR